MTDEDDDLGWYEEVHDFPKQKVPWSYRTKVAGLFKFLFPWFGGNVSIEWPTSGRQAMLTICVVVPAVCLTIMVEGYTIFVGATPENISSFGRIVRNDDDKPEKLRAPERVPVKTDDGIEIIEVCPPCEECPPCPVQMPCPPCTCSCPAKIEVQPGKAEPTIEPDPQFKIAF